MRTFSKVFFYSFFLIAFALNANAQNNYPFKKDRTIQISNPFPVADQVTFYFRAQSFSKDKSTGYGSYKRILGATSYNVELADYRGKLALFNGRAWYELDVDIRKEKKDIFLTFDKGMIKVMVGNKLVTEKKHPEKVLKAPAFYIGSNYNRSEKFNGEIDYVAILNYIIKPHEIADIVKFGSSHIQRTSPTIFYDFTKGIMHKAWKNPAQENMPLDIGIQKRSPRVEADVVEFETLSRDEEAPYKNEKPQVEKTMPDISKRTEKPQPEVAYETIEAPPLYGEEPVKPDPNKKFDRMKTIKEIFGLNFNIEFDEVYRGKKIFEGTIKSNLHLIEPGSYDMIIEPGGKVTIKIKTAKDD